MLLICANLILENTLQLSLCKPCSEIHHCLQNSQYPLYFHHYHRQHWQHHRSHHQHHRQQPHFAPLNNEFISQSTCSRVSPVKIVSSASCRSALTWNLGLKKVECLYLYILFLAYFYFTKICEPLVTFGFNFSILNSHFSTISSFCLYFTFLVKTGWVWGVIFLLLVKRGGCQKFCMMFR